MKISQFSKYLSVVLIAAGMFSTYSFADDSNDTGESEIPTTATLLFQTSGQVRGFKGNGSDSLPKNGCQAIDPALANWMAQSSAQNLEYVCQKVYRLWRTPVMTETKNGTFHKSIDRTYTLSLVTYCEPRDLQQQQILSLKKSCQIQPSQECFSKDFLDYLGRLALTEYIDVNRPECK